jgi:DNA-binding Lrp family transcriptional regulator
MYESDEIDLRIVELLMEDGRMPAAEKRGALGEISLSALSVIGSSGWSLKK